MSDRYLKKWGSSRNVHIYRRTDEQKDGPCKIELTRHANHLYMEICTVINIALRGKLHILCSARKFYSEGEGSEIILLLGNFLGLLYPFLAPCRNMSNTHLI